MVFEILRVVRLTALDLRVETIINGFTFDADLYLTALEKKISMFMLIIPAYLA